MQNPNEEISGKRTGREGRTTAIGVVRLTALFEIVLLVRLNIRDIYTAEHMVLAGEAFCNVCVCVCVCGDSTSKYLLFIIPTTLQ